MNKMNFKIFNEPNEDLQEYLDRFDLDKIIIKIIQLDGLFSDFIKDSSVDIAEDLLYFFLLDLHCKDALLNYIQNKLQVRVSAPLGNDNFILVLHLL